MSGPVLGVTAALFGSPPSRSLRSKAHQLPSVPWLTPPTPGLSCRPWGAGGEPPRRGGDGGLFFLSGNVDWTWFCWAVFACFSARFSFSDLPGFLDMCWRGDLSAIVAP